MSTTLRWIVSGSASAFHAAEALAQGRELADAGLAEAIREPVRHLAAVIDASGIPAAAFWAHAGALAAGIHNNRELASLSLAKILGRSPKIEPLASPFAAVITALENAYNAWAPNANDDLELRSGPLRQQWEARGPGMLAQVGRSTQLDVIVEQADVMLVHPALGGAGRAHLPYNSVRIEAVLADPHAALPETVRLAWLLSQLNHDLPMHQGNLPRERVAEVGGLACVPPILDAAESVELVRYDVSTIARSLSRRGTSR